MGQLNGAGGESQTSCAFWHVDLVRILLRPVFAAWCLRSECLAHQGFCPASRFNAHMQVEMQYATRHRDCHCSPMASAVWGTGECHHRTKDNEQCLANVISAEHRR